jgi:predicted dithiol-disulfide oxidoreductase (DUF899 family)
MPTWDKNIAILVLIIDKLRRLRVANPYNSASTAYSHQQLHVNNDFAELFEGSHMLRYPVQVGHDHDHVCMGTIQLIWNSHSIREGHLKNKQVESTAARASQVMEAKETWKAGVSFEMPSLKWIACVQLPLKNTDPGHTFQTWTQLGNGHD